jgi:hypothetical protein
VRVSPLAVARFIALVVVYAIQRLAVRPLAHVGEKVFEHQPTVAYVNASPAIVFVIFVAWIVATLPQANPTDVGWGKVSVSNVAVLGFDRKAVAT